MDRDDTGFTLVELLVVILIIGILAGIALPVLLAQRRKGYEAQAKSDLRTLAIMQESYLTDHPDAYATLAQLQAAYGYRSSSPGETVTVTTVGSTSWSLRIDDADAATSWCMDSIGSGPSRC